MKIISKRKRENGEPLFTLTKKPYPNERNEYLLEEYNDRVNVIITKTKKGYELEFFLVNNFLKTFISNTDIIEE